jgi:hypothetical protein
VLDPRLYRSVLPAFQRTKKTLWDDLGRVLEPIGVKMHGPYYDCQWSNDNYMTWFMMEYPSIETAIMDTHGAQKIQLFRYLVSETILGIEEENVNGSMAIQEE